MINSPDPKISSETKKKVLNLFMSYTNDEYKPPNLVAPTKRIILEPKLVDPKEIDISDILKM